MPVRKAKLGRSKLTVVKEEVVSSDDDDDFGTATPMTAHLAAPVAPIGLADQIAAERDHARELQERAQALQVQEEEQRRLVARQLAEERYQAREEAAAAGGGRTELSRIEKRYADIVGGSPSPSRGNSRSPRRLEAARAGKAASSSASSLRGEDEARGLQQRAQLAEQSAASEAAVAAADLAFAHPR